MGNYHKTYYEHAPKKVWPSIKKDKLVRKYMPTYEMIKKNFWPDRKFFWGVVNTLRPEFTKLYF